MLAFLYVSLIEPIAFANLNIYSVATSIDEGQLCSVGM
jgi:hypothetical protein